MSAFESFADANGGSYVVAGSGGGGGEGWFQYSDNSHYQTSIAGALVAGGHLPAAYLTDPADTNRDHHLRVGRDFLVYRCKDRIGVFAKPDLTSTTPAAADTAWWTNNGCIRYPIDTYGHTYFALSKSSDIAGARAAAVRQAVEALESYGSENGSYTVAGGGGGGDGQGWYQYTDNASYQTSSGPRLSDLSMQRSHWSLR